MYNSTTLIDAISNIDDQYLNRYFSKKSKHEKHNCNKTSKTSHTKLKWVSVVAACLALVISISAGIWINRLSNEQMRTNDYSLIKLYGDESKLYFIDTRNQSNLISYNLEDGRIDTLIDKTINQAAIIDTELFFTTSEGMYVKNLETGTEEKMMDFSGLKTDSVTSVNDMPLFEEAIIEGCSDFNKNGSIVYFLYGAKKKLSIDEHNVIGNECWNTIYAYNLVSHELFDIKSAHSICSYLSEKDFVTDRPEIPVLLHDTSFHSLHFYNGNLYYITGSAEIRSIKADGTDDNAVYASKGTIRNIIWNNQLGYISESVENNNNTEAYHTVLSLNDKTVISETRVETNLFSTFDNLCYDMTNNRFYTIFENNIISFAFDKPADYTVLYTFNIGIDHMQTNLIVVGGNLFCSYYDAVSNNSDYYIIRISNNQEEIIVKNGAPYDE